MKKLVFLCIAAVGAAMLLFGTAPAASAYPDLTCNVSLDRQVIHPGDTFTATGQSASSASWTFTFNGVTKARTGSLVHATFTAPQVNSSRTLTLTARANGIGGTTCVHHLNVTVAIAAVAAPTAGGGVLPSTGGPAFWLLVGGLLLLVGGGGAVVVARKRD